MSQPNSREDVIEGIRAIRQQLRQVNDAINLGVIDGSEPEFGPVMRRLRDDLDQLEGICET